MNSTAPVYLNVCEGSSVLPGFLNIGQTSDAEIIHDVRYGIPLDDASVDGILAEHVLELLTLGECLGLLRECRRVLKPGAILRLVTMDLDRLVAQYVENKWRTPWLNKNNAQWIRNRAQYLNFRLRDRRAQWTQNEEELTFLAKMAGLASGSRRTRDEGLDEVLRTHPLTTDDTTLVVEFCKHRYEDPAEPLVSIIIPAYKPAHFGECLDSAICQTYRNIEIIVLDDSPSDAIELATMQRAESDSRIRYLRNQPRLGETKSFGKGVSLSQGHFIKPLYDDDVLLPEAVERLLSALNTHSGCTLAVGRRVLIDEKGEVLDLIPATSTLLTRSGAVRGALIVSDIAASGVNVLGEPSVMMFRKEDIATIDEPTLMSLMGRHCGGLGDIVVATHLLSRGDLAYTTNTVALFRLHDAQAQNRSDMGSVSYASWLYYREQVTRLGFHPANFNYQEGALSTQSSPERQSTTAGWKEAPDMHSQHARAHYHEWLHLREVTREDIKHFSQRPELQPQVGFSIVIRLKDERDLQRLGETLDSLNQQILGPRKVCIVGPVAPPSHIEDGESYSWTVVGSEDCKSAIDVQLLPSSSRWAIELPPGAVLDPLCLWRVAREIGGNNCAIYVDDDVYDDKGNRHSPRFKPDANPAWMQSADLCGPLFIRQDIWHSTGGAGGSAGSPWFGQLIRISQNIGWNFIGHVADVLISYANAFPSDSASCLHALIENLNGKGVDADYVPISPTAWGIRYPLAPPPRISVCILSTGQFDLLARCVTSVIEHTEYPDYEIIIVTPEATRDIELRSWIEECGEVSGGAVRWIPSQGDKAISQRISAIAASAAEFVTFLDESCVVLDGKWLEELTRAAMQPGVAAVAPRIISGGEVMLVDAGNVLGLMGSAGAPYQCEIGIKESGYLDYLHIARDISILGESCFLIRTSAWRETDLATASELRSFGLADVCLQLLANKQRIVYQPFATIAVSNQERINVKSDKEFAATETMNAAHDTNLFFGRWADRGFVDRWWNPNLSLNRRVPTLETDYLAQWRHIPLACPRILASPVPNVQGDYRIKSYLSALRRAGKVGECIWPQTLGREATLAELMRLSPDAVVVHHFLLDRQLAALTAWNRGKNRPFIAYALDDLVTNMDPTNPFRKGHAANNRTRLKYALEHCDRLVVTTDFLADCNSQLIKDICIVPNRLEMAAWLPLKNNRRDARKPRIGWAGGVTHQSDLILLKEIIEQTRGEADWIFFGMCPQEIKPLLAEYHEPVPFAEYPAYLASLGLDIAVAPLAFTTFNQAKSNLRLLEYGVLGIPVVCSNIDPYRGSPACLVDNTPDAWLNAIRQRIHDADGRDAEGRNLARWVKDKFLIENHMDEWLSAHLPNA